MLTVPIDRRAVLRALGAAALAACAPRSAEVATIPSAGLRLGWRWVPGQELRYLARIERTVDGVVERLAERWTYLVRGVDPAGVAILEATLVGVGGDVRSDSGPLADVDAALSRARGGRTATLRIGEDGRLHPFVDGGCARVGLPVPPCFEAQLPHRLLALPLPITPVAVHDAWDDGQLCAPFDALLPAEVDRDAVATCRVLEVGAEADGRASVILGSSGVVRPRAGPSLTLEGQTTWDPIRGRLRARVLSATLAGATGPGSPGRLTASLSLEP